VTDFAILGFLMRGPMSGYDIKRCMAMSTAHFYQASFGSIYPALERMEAEGLARSARSGESGRLRKAYEISPEGRAAFMEWLASPLDLSKGPSALLIRVFFLGSLPRDAARRSVGVFREAAGKRGDWVKSATEGLPVEPDFFQAATRDFGVAYYAFVESWLDGLGERMAAARPAARKKRKEAP
jgi:DNA-binding PadR family transcriptional regulator